ncbi:uncharacterized protein LOC113580388 isoform X2 [Electrophorus electricus]|uniref:uncharacterized protein LOC113580388 isoform X2 n=1 Tax=Electrophorus electricus TaxID=8005 RepID=UPI0015CFBD02|nr:uncharacterized protein LOC113580388 isoform X2 [Electrophorus electricus]
MKGRRPYHRTVKGVNQSEDEKEKQVVQEEDGLSSSLCPLCGRDFDMPLLLPCSHTLCGRCLTEGARLDKHRPAVRGVSSHPVCAVLCPRCCHGVELPCFDWSSAIRCLPIDPTVSTGAECGAAVCQLPERQQEEDENEQYVRTNITMRSGLFFALHSAAPSLHLTNSTLTATFRGDTSAWGNYGDQSGEHDSSTRLPQVCGNVAIHRGQYYWEVDVCNSALYRVGVCSLDGDQAWWFERRGPAFHAVFDGRHELLPSVPPQLKTVGVFLNVGGFSLTFHNPLTQELLTAIPSHFIPPLCPAFQLGQGRLKLRPGLPPPSHIFLSCSTAYRGPEGAGGGRWKRDVAFRSVRTVIQKFEEMAMSDSDSGLMSSYSSSSQASLPEPNPETVHPNG